MKLKAALLFITILVLLMGVATANDLTADTTSTDTPTSDTPLVLEKAVQEKPTVSQGDTNTVEKINKKQETKPTSQITTTNIQKNTNNLKKDTTASSWETLESEINSATQDTTITLKGGTYTVTNTINFNKAITITIDGNGQTIDGNQNHVFEIKQGSSVILKNITIKNSKNDGWWGAILNGGNLIINNSTLINNTATTTELATSQGGGAIHNYGKLTITDSTLENNQATGYTEGGAIINAQGTITITNSTLKNNQAPGGGAISNLFGIINITDSNLTQNTATGQNRDGYGGAINNWGTLTITQSNLTQNTATGQNRNGHGGAIYNAYGGTLNITGSNLTQNTATGQDGKGGAIYNIDGTVTITQSNFTQNKASGLEYGYGGAIHNTGGTINITQSNLTQNTATGRYGTGGAIYNNGGTLNITQSNLTQNNATGQQDGVGGAIYNNCGTLNITQSNLTQNTATGQEYVDGGAIYNDHGTINITQSNLNNNTATGQEYVDGGAIYNDGGTLNITQSNLTQNKATGQNNNGYGGAIYNLDGTLTITQSNLTHNTATGYEDERGGAIYNNGSNYNITGTTFYNNAPANFIINQENHIELTRTDDYISVGSFTIIADDTVSTGTSTDDFNNIQVLGDNIKLIFNGTNMINNTYILRSNTRTVSDYPALIAAIEEAKNDKYNKFIINLQPGGDYNATGNIQYEDSLTKNITINGNGQILDGLNTYQFIKIAQEHNLTLTNITITNYTAEEGGAINNTGNLTIINSTLNNNTATGQNNGYGGAILNYGGTLNITQSNLTQNTATGQNTAGLGGAIYNYYGTLTITESNLTQNTATGYEDGHGGAIYNNHGTLTITQSNLTQNKATGQNGYGFGGAIHNYHGTINITQSNLTQNTATGYEDGRGGAIYNNQGNLTITQSNLTQNNATRQTYDGYGRGGAIYNYYGTLTITQSNLTQNKATGQNGYGFGGAIHNWNGTITITSNTILQNNTAEYGGAIVNNGTRSNLTILDSILENNNASIGGALYNVMGILSVRNTNLTYNNADNGGAIFIDKFDSSSSGNPDDSQQSYKDRIIITGCRLDYNNATFEGGALFGNENTFIMISGCDFNYDLAAYGGAIESYGTVNITESTFKYNVANGAGAIDCSGEGYITDSNLTCNNATLFGGAIINGNEILIIEGCNISNNSVNNAPEDDDGDDLLLVSYSGGAIYNNGILNIKTTKIESNYAPRHAGAIYNNNAYLAMFNVTLNNNIAEDNGGVLINNVSMTLDDTILGYITVNDEEVACYPGTVIITKSTIRNNTAYEVGAILNEYGNMNISDTSIQNNNASISIIENLNGNLTIKNTNIINNTATTIGNIILNFANQDSVYDQVYGLAKNIKTAPIADEIEKIESNLIIINSTLNNNKAFSGVIANMVHSSDEYPECYGNVQVKDSTFKYNQASFGGVIYNNGKNSNTNVTNSTIELNNANYGGAILNEEGMININTTVFTNNTADIGSAIYNMANATIYNNTFKTNKASTGEKAIEVTGGNPIIKDNINDKTSRYYSTIETNGEEVSITNNIFNDNTINTSITITTNNTNPTVEDKIKIIFTLKGNDNNLLANQNITINIDGTIYNKTTDNTGTATVDYILKTNITQVTADYNGYYSYNQSNASKDIIAKKINTKLTLNVSNTTPINNTALTITATLTDAKNNKLAGYNIILNLNGKTVTVKTDNNGLITQSYTPTTLGKQTITATYNGNNKYINSTANTNITVKKINTKLALKVSNSTPVLNTSINITATLTDIDGNKLSGQNVTITAGGKTSTVKTNTNGQAILVYTPTKAETQNITATYKGNSQYNNSTATTTITVKKINTKIDLKVSNNTPINNTPINITVTLTDADNNKLANQQVTLNINGKTVTAKTNTNGIITQNYTPTKVETQNITATYTGDSRYNNSTKTIQITVKNRIKTQTTVTPVTGVIGEKLTIKATVTDTNGNNVNEGNLIFKVNGVTIKDNGKLTGSSNPLKIKIVNGVATATITPDINMTNAKNITAYYVGTTIYNASTSSPANMNISKRNATIEVTTNKKIIKQGQILTITAKIYDTTNGKKTNNITRYQDEYVYFKVNGITLKDANGEMLKVKIINGTATVNYTIPLGISCVMDTQSMTPKNHTIQVGLYNKNYQNIMTKTPTFQTERSNITINLANATINNKTHTLSMKITIKDYLKNTVIGPNKLVIKVNGLTLKNGTNVQYYYTTDGVLNIKNIPIPTAKNYTSIEVITQDRLAYTSQRNTTTKIKVLN